MWKNVLKMITNFKIGFDGRFGNQIFQFAGLFGISRKIGYQLVIPENNLIGKNKNYNGSDFIEKFDLYDCFKIDTNFLGIPTDIQRIYHEKTFHFDSNFFSILDNSEIHGYFQSEKYFEHCKDELLSNLQFREEILDISKELLPYQNKDLVSIHIRRGDYLNAPNYHPVVTKEYIDKSIDYINKNGEYHFVIFSDDIDWCEYTWSNKNNFTFFKSNSQFIDFCAMSLCKHHIISNSSFSWWSSYLSKSENKIIIAPAKWFGNGFSHYNTDDLYTKNMIKI
jgi:hypothetical protein